MQKFVLRVELVELPRATTTGPSPSLLRVAPAYLQGLERSNVGVSGIGGALHQTRVNDVNYVFHCHLSGSQKETLTMIGDTRGAQVGQTKFTDVSARTVETMIFLLPE